jgi:hypothetical protein
MTEKKDEEGKGKGFYTEGTESTEFAENGALKMRE